MTGVSGSRLLWALVLAMIMALALPSCAGWRGSSEEFVEQVVDVRTFIGLPADEAFGVIYSGSKDPRAANPSVAVSFVERPNPSESRGNFVGWSVLGMCVPEREADMAGRPGKVTLQMLLTRQDPAGSLPQDSLRQWRSVLQRFCDDDTRTTFTIRH